jgi:uncharacterized protein (DUF427 family)
MKTPGPDHPIGIAASRKRLRILHGGHLIGGSDAALILTEASYPPVAYFPRADVAMDYLARTERHTHCPYKGEASYYSLVRDGEVAENAVWTYEDPFPAVEAIRDHLAFYPNQVVIQEVEEVHEPDIDAVVQHTDSGSGAA